MDEELLWHYNKDLGMYDIYQRQSGELYEIVKIDRVKPGPRTDPTRRVMDRIRELESVLF